MTEDELRELLPEQDADYLLSKALADRVTVHRVGAEIHVVFRQYEFPGQYRTARADLLVRLIPPYPNASPDMFWTSPDVLLTSGQMPQASAYKEVPAPQGQEDAYNRAAWQRWSRHYPRESWRPNIDGLRSYMASVRLEINKGR